MMHSRTVKYNVKIAASKAKGLWMGGNPMLGYTPRDRTLEIDPAEAETVRHIFTRYLELGSVHALQADLAARGIRAKSWITKKGSRAGGGVLARGALYHLLRNRHYRGEIVHKDVVHPGQHPAIIDAALFDAVQASLDANARQRRERPLRVGGSPLTGLIFDDAGHAMSPTHARGKAGSPHRYYVSKALLTGQSDQAGSLGRMPAKIIENVVADRLSLLLAAPFSWGNARALINRIILRPTAVEIELSDGATTDELTERLPVGDHFDPSRRTIIVQARLGRRGGAMRLLDPGGRRVVDRPEPDPALVQAIAKGWRWRGLLVRGAFPNSSALAQVEGLTQTSLHRFVRLTYLAPDLLRQILDGRQRPGLTLDQLCRADLPLDWTSQRRLFSASTEA